MTLSKESLSHQELRALEDSLNLKFLPYSAKNAHKELMDSIENLLQLVETKRNLIAASLDW
jgi:hypothetical protein